MKTINLLKKAFPFTLIFVFVHCAVIAQHWIQLPLKK